MLSEVLKQRKKYLDYCCSTKFIGAHPRCSWAFSPKMPSLFSIPTDLLDKEITWSRGFDPRTNMRRLADAPKATRTTRSQLRVSGGRARNMVGHIFTRLVCDTDGVKTHARARERARARARQDPRCLPRREHVGFSFHFLSRIRCTRRTFLHVFFKRRTNKQTDRLTDSP